MPLVIVTGGPGAGKRTCSQRSPTLGYTTSEGSARAIIAERVLCILTNSGA